MTKKALTLKNKIGIILGENQFSKTQFGKTGDADDPTNRLEYYGG